MAVYEYKGLDTDGKAVGGIIDADSPKGARLKLKQSGIYPTDVTAPADSKTISWPKKGIPFPLMMERVTLQDLSVLTRQLATLLGAGLTLMESLTALMEQVENKGLQKVIAGIRERVEEGNSFADALRTYPKVFSGLYVHMVRAGEASGTIEGMMLRLADFLEHQVRLRNRVIASMTYPILMMAIGVVILFGLITFVVPMVTRTFEEMHQTLPLPTRLLIGLSNFMEGYWFWILIFAGVTTFFVKRYLKTPGGREKYDGLILNLPLVGRIVRMIALSRLSRTLSTLLASGVPLLQAIQIVKDVVNNKVLEKVLDEASKNIKEGETIAGPLKKSGVIPPLVTHMIAVGEKSGELEGMLLKVAEVYDAEVETTVSTLTSLLAPVMILAMGVVVLFIVLAILVPIFELSQIVR